MYLVDTRVGHPKLDGMEVSAAGRRGRHHDPARRHRPRSRRAARDPAADAARPAPLDALRRRGVPRRMGGRAVEPGRAKAGVRVHLARSQAGAAARRRRGHRRGARRARGDGATFFESGNGRVNWRYLPASNEIIWFSERDNWGHLYLYDLDDRPAEEPDHDRRGERHPAPARGREEPRALLPRRRPRAGRDPYFSHLYRIGFDGSTWSC